jgi:hypothetical protein
MVNRWGEIGGRLVIVPSVLEEASYHAWIANNEYQNIWRDLESIKANEINRYASNAFVRAFYHTAAGKFDPTNWNRFISEYRGESPQDTTKLEGILRDSGFEVVCEYPYDKNFASSVIQEIYRVRGISPSDFVPKKVGDKVVRDGNLIAHLKNQRESMGQAGKTIVIVSSSSVLETAAMKFGQELMEPAPVWPIGAIAYLISLIPGVKMTLKSLGTALFVDYSSEAIEAITRLALRVIRQSAQYDLGYSRRVTLKKALLGEISQAAKQRGMTTSELTQEMVDPQGKQLDALTEVVARGVDQIVASKYEQEMDELRRKIEGR